MAQTAGQDSLYQEAAETYGGALERLARAYEAEPEARRDLLQDIHVALWRSFAGFNGRCSLRTWVYRVAHNIGASHISRQRRAKTVVSLDDLERMPDVAAAVAAERRDELDLLLALIQRLQPLERQVILSYLEGMDAVAIAEISGISPGNVATKIHRIKRILAHWFQDGGHHAE